MNNVSQDDFYNFSREPFGETPDPKFYFASDTHRLALARLKHAIDSSKGFSLLTGEVGMGKTLISRILLGGTEGKTGTVDSALVLYPNCTESELIRTVCRELGLLSTSQGSLGHQDDLDRLNEFLILNVKMGRKTVLLIDEAQNMPQATLETVRLLSNLETSNRKLIHTILCAQPEFLQRLSRNDCRQLDQRISSKVSLSAFDSCETERYIKHRIECAGGSNFVRFESDACALIQRETRGTPRKINDLCQKVLISARTERLRLISKAFIKSVIGNNAPKSNFLQKLLKRAEASLG